MNTGDHLLDALRAFIREESVTWPEALTEEEWQALITLAREQNVLPMLVESLHRSPAFLAQPADQRQELKSQCLRLTAVQTMRSAAFLTLYSAMEAEGLHPLVMKGLVCRSLYPQPDCRPSSDEDLLVSSDEFIPAADFLRAHGFHDCDPNAAPDAFELGFLRRDGLYLELHQSPFSPDSHALGDFNRFFSLAAQNACRIEVGGGTVATLSPHDHMLYLLLHAYKHFIHSGFGIRQVCDIVLWAERWGEEIDWARLKEQCGQVRGWPFALALLSIGRARLGFDGERARFPADYWQEDIPWQAVLKDLLSAGVFGGKDLSRKHSSTVTLRTVESERQGKSYSLAQTLFPSRAQLAGRYPYLNKSPLLLPIAWAQRLLHYGSELSRSGGSSSSESLRIGKERTQLLRSLGMID